MRLMRVGANPMNKNPKLARLAAMMDQHKIDEYVKVDQQTHSRPVSRSGLSYNSSATSVLGSLHSPTDSRAASPQPQQANHPAVVDRSPERHERLCATPALSSPVAMKAPPALTPVSSPTKNPDRWLTQILTEEDYWRGYQELMEGQRRYYLWTFLRRGELPQASQVFQVGLSPNVSRHVIEADIARRARPSSAQTTIAMPSTRVPLLLPPRPASGASRIVFTDAPSTGPHLRTNTLEVASIVVPQAHRLPTGVVSMVSPSAMSDRISPLGRSLSPSIEDNHSKPISPMSPRMVILRELQRRLEELMDDTADDEQIERTAMEDKEESSRHRMIILPWQYKVLPAQEASARADLIHTEQSIFFRIVSDTSRYLYVMEQAYLASRSRRVAVYDASVAAWQRVLSSRSAMEQDELKHRSDIVYQEAHVSRCLVRRYHQHMQVMLLREKAYRSAIHTYYVISQAAAHESLLRTAMEEEANTVAQWMIHVASMLRLRMLNHVDVQHEMQEWFMDSTVAANRQERRRRELLANMIATKELEHTRRMTMTRTNMRFCDALLTLRNLGITYYKDCDGAFAEELHGRHTLIAEAQRFTSHYAEQYTCIVHPEAAHRREVVAEAKQWKILALSYHDMATTMESQLRHFMHFVEMEYDSTAILLERLAEVEQEEHKQREHILDLEDDSYHFDFIICTQRMRRLDTVRSFIIASPGQERNNRLAIEAEQREGLYLLMELNDHILYITRNAQATHHTKWNMYIAHEHSTTRLLTIVWPEESSRIVLQEEGERYAKLCSQELTAMQAWEGECDKAVEATTKSFSILFDTESSFLFSMSDATVHEGYQRNAIVAEELSTWELLWRAVQVGMLEDIESMQRAQLCDTADVLATAVQDASNLNLSFIATMWNDMHSMDSLFDRAAMEVESASSVQDMEGACNRERCVLEELESLLQCTIRRYQEYCAASQQEYIVSSSCAWPFANASRDLESLHAAELDVHHIVHQHLVSIIRCLELHRAIVETSFNEATSMMQITAMPKTESTARMIVVNDELILHRLVATKEHHLRCRLYPTAATILDAHRVAVAEYCQETWNAHKQQLASLEGPLQEVETGYRNQHISNEANVRALFEVLRTLTESQDAITHAHNTSVVAALNQEKQFASERRSLFVDYATTRDHLSTVEADTWASLFKNLKRLGSEALSIEAQRLEALDRLLDASQRRLTEFLNSLRQNHHRELATKAARILCNDPTCSSVDFGWNDGAHPFTDETMELLHYVLQGNTYVERIVLSNNAFGTTSISRRTISLLCDVSQRLTTIELKCCALTDGDVQPLIQVLPLDTCTVTTLYLDDNHLNTDTCKAMLAALRDRDSTLIDVTMNDNPAVARGMTNVVAFYSQLNRQPHFIKEEVLKIEDNDPFITTWSGRGLDLGDEHVKLICIALFQNSHITTVDFQDQSRLTDGCCASIASMLRGNASIVCMELAGTSIGDQGLLQIEHVIKQQPYRQPLMYKNLFGTPPAVIMRRRSSRFLNQSLRRASMAGFGMSSQPVAPPPPEESNSLSSFVLSIHRTRVSDKKYLRCVLDMNELERSLVDMDEDDAFELTVECFCHLKSLIEDAHEALAEIAYTYECTEVVQHNHFINKVFTPLEQRLRAHLIHTSELEWHAFEVYANVMEVMVQDTDSTFIAISKAYTWAEQVAITSAKMKEWEPNSDQRLVLDAVWVPEHKERKHIEEVHDAIIKLLDRFAKYGNGSARFFDKCHTAKEQTYSKSVEAIEAAMRKLANQRSPSVVSLPFDNGADTTFIPMELDPKQHQALAHLANQPWELQGKGLGIAQDDPSVTALDISFAGVANKEEPPCTQDTIAVLYTLAKNNTHLVEVNLSGNPGAVTGRCAPLLSKLASRLITLNLGDCSLNEEQVLPHLLGALAHPSVRLETLILDGNNITAQGATQLCRALRNNLTVSKVSLERLPQPIPKVSLDFVQFYTDVNKLPRPYRSLIRRLEANDATCNEADFTNTAAIKRSNNFRSAEVDSAAGCDSDDESVAPYRSGQSRPRTSALDDAALKLICIALSRNMVVERLHLGGNHITDRGMKFLTHVLQNSPSIKWLDVSQNRFTDAGGTLLIKVAEKNSRLQEIRMTTNDGAVGVHTRRLLAAQVQKNKS